MPEFIEFVDLYLNLIKNFTDDELNCFYNLINNNDKDVHNKFVNKFIIEFYNPYVICEMRKRKLNKLNGYLS